MEEEISFSYSLIVRMDVVEEKEISSLTKAISSFSTRKNKGEEISLFSSSNATSFIATKEEEKKEEISFSSSVIAIEEEDA